MSGPRRARLHLFLIPVDDAVTAFFAELGQLAAFAVDLECAGEAHEGEEAAVAREGRPRAVELQAGQLFEVLAIDAHLPQLPGQAVRIRARDEAQREQGERAAVAFG